MSPHRCRLCGIPCLGGVIQEAHPQAVLCYRCADCGEPGPANVARRTGRRELVVVTHSAAVLSKLVAAGASEREPGVLVLPRRPEPEVSPC